MMLTKAFSGPTPLHQQQLQPLQRITTFVQRRILHLPFPHEATTVTDPKWTLQSRRTATQRLPDFSMIRFRFERFRFRSYETRTGRSRIRRSHSPHHIQAVSQVQCRYLHHTAAVLSISSEVTSSDPPDPIRRPEDATGVGIISNFPQPVFQVIQMGYSSSSCSSSSFVSVSMSARELLQATGVLVRDLVTLNLTSIQQQEQQQSQSATSSSHAIQDQNNPRSTTTMRRPRRDELASISYARNNQRGETSRNHNHHHHQQQLRTLGDIMPRDTHIVVSFGNIRAVVGLTQVILGNAHEPMVQHFAQELAGAFRRAQQSFFTTSSSSSSSSSLSSSSSQSAMELVFLEHLLKDTLDSYHRQLRLFEPIVDRILDQVSHEVYSDIGGLHLLVPLKDSLKSFELQIKQSYECLTGLLEDDDLMLQLLLTEQLQARQSGREVALSRHESVELMVGVYVRRLSNLLLETQYLLGRLQSQQEFVALALASYRNRMIRVNVNLSILTVALGVGTATAGFFGMNLLHGLETSPTAFVNIVAGSSIAGCALAGGSFYYLSGPSLKARARQRADEIETLELALQDLSAVDYAIKCIRDEGRRLNKAEFRDLLVQARSSHSPNGSSSNSNNDDKQVDILFDILDKIPDGSLAIDDLQQWSVTPESVSSEIEK